MKHHEYPLAIISYAPEDRRFRVLLEKHLTPYLRAKRLEFWAVDMIPVGADRDHEIRSYIDLCDTLLPLVSADFLSSKQCWEREFLPALQLEKHVIPIIVRSCAWDQEPALLDIQCLPRDGSPLALADDLDTVVSQLCAAIIPELQLSVSRAAGSPGPAHSGSCSSLPPRLSDTDRVRIREILALCYRRAVFARMHAQMSLEAMFSSLAECRMGLQRRIVLVESNEAQRSIAGVIGEVDFIERRGVLSISGDCIAVDEINAAKTRIIRALLHLRDMAEVSFVLPLSTTEEVFFTEEEATSPPRELQ